MLRLHPALVDMGRARDFRSAWLDRGQRLTTLVPEGAVGFGWETQDLHPAGALGDASIATVEDGERVVAFTAERLATLFDEVRRFDIDTWLRDTPADLPNN